MRLFAAFLVAGIAASGSAHASSFAYLDSDATSPSSVFIGLNEAVASSFVVLGTMPVDSGTVAAVDSRPTSHRMGPKLMVIRGGEIGSASAEPSAGAHVPAPARQAAAGSEAPLPATEPAAALREPQ